MKFFIKHTLIALALIVSQNAFTQCYFYSVETNNASSQTAADGSIDLFVVSFLNAPEISLLVLDSDGSFIDFITMPNATTAHIANLPAATYNIEIFDDFGCSTSALGIVVGYLSGFETNTLIFDSPDNGCAEGSIYAAANNLSLVNQTIYFSITDEMGQPVVFGDCSGDDVTEVAGINNQFKLLCSIAAGTYTVSVRSADYSIQTDFAPVTVGEAPCTISVEATYVPYDVAGCAAGAVTFTTDNTESASAYNNLYLYKLGAGGIWQVEQGNIFLEYGDTYTWPVWGEGQYKMVAQNACFSSSCYAEVFFEAVLPPCVFPLTIDTQPSGLGCSSGSAQFGLHSGYSCNSYIIEINGPDGYTHTAHAGDQIVNLAAGVYEAIYQPENAGPNACFASTQFEILEITCPGDLTCDQTVNVSDLLLFSSEFGSTNCANCIADLNGDDAVNTADLLLFTSTFGTMCQFE